MKNKKIFLLLIFLLLITYYLLLHKAFAQTATSEFPLIFKEIKADVTLSKNNLLLITENFQLQFPSSSFSWKIEGPFSNLKIKANQKELGKKTIKIEKEGDKKIIKTKSQSTLNFQVEYEVQKALTPIQENYEFRLPIVSEEEFYIPKITVYFHLPKEVDVSKIQPNLYAIHGVEKWNAKVLDKKTIIFLGEGLAPFSSFTIAPVLPKEIVSLSFFSKLRFYLEGLSFIQWLILAILIPVLTWLFLLLMLFFKKTKEKLKRPKKETDFPPFDLPPALLGLLLREKVSQRDIASTILDLTKRGFIEIVAKKGEYVLGKREGKGKLKPFEALVYSKIFVEKNEIKIKRTEFEIEKRAREQLYSPKITQFVKELYLEGVKQGYFVENPGLYSLRYKTAGILFFFLSCLISFLVVLFNPLWIFGSLGMMAASLLIIKNAPFMPKRTKKGEEILKRWFCFENFLKDEKPLGLTEAQKGLYEQYLPYAITFGCEIDWTLRFSQAPYTLPSWFTGEGEYNTLELFSSHLFYILNSLSSLLFYLKEPSLG